MPDTLNPTCVPRMISVNSAAGSISRADVEAMTPDKIASLDMDELGALQLIMNAAEAKAIGVQETGLGALLRGSVRDVKPMMFHEKVETQSVVAPFIQYPQRGIINANYWTIAAGEAAAGAGTGGIPASAWKLTITAGQSLAGYDGSPTDIYKFFLPGMHLVIETWDATGTKVARTLEMEIISSAANGTSADVVVAAPYSTDTAWNALSAGEKAVYQPTFGVAMVSANSINGHESWCEQHPIPMSKKLIVCWLQDTRDAFSIDDEYKFMLEKILSGKVNPYQANFNYTPLAEQRKLAQARADAAWYNSVFYGEPINELQTPSTWKQLPAIEDPNEPGFILGYKAKAEGLLYKLDMCGRVIDLEGAALNLDSIFQYLYQLAQHRGADGDSVTRIDTMTDMWTKNKIFDSMTKYYQARYGVNIEKNYTRGEKLVHDGWVAFEGDLYDVPEAGVQWYVISDHFFTHRFNQFNRQVSAVDFSARGRTLWFIDWADFRIGDAGNRQKVSKWPKEDVLELYKCRMDIRAKEYVLRERTWTVMVDRPHRHLVVHNFSGDCPVVAQPGCTVPNPAT